MLNLSHKNLTVWQLSVEFVTQVYEVSANFPKEEKYHLTNQIRRAAISVPSNIAEGASRISIAEKKRFFEIAECIKFRFPTLALTSSGSEGVFSGW